MLYHTATTTTATRPPSSAISDRTTHQKQCCGSQRRTAEVPLAKHETSIWTAWSMVQASGASALAYFHPIIFTRPGSSAARCMSYRSSFVASKAREELSLAVCSALNRVDQVAVQPHSMSWSDTATRWLPTKKAMWHLIRSTSKQQSVRPHRKKIDFIMQLFGPSEPDLQRRKQVRC